MESYAAEVEQTMQRFYHCLSEKDRRRYAAVEAMKLGWGGKSYISQLFGCDDESMQLGLSELKDETALKMSRIRRQGGGRPKALETIEDSMRYSCEWLLNILPVHRAMRP